VGCSRSGETSRASITLRVGFRDEALGVYDEVYSCCPVKVTFSRPELCPSDGRSCHFAADSRRPCEGARHCQACGGQRAKCYGT